jgi:hypothetical protein
MTLAITINTPLILFHLFMHVPARIDFLAKPALPARIDAT